MSKSNGGKAPDPVPVLSGHLYLFEGVPPSGCLLVFRPDGDGPKVDRPMIQMAAGQMIELLTPGDGGMLAAVMNGKIPKMTPKQARQMRATAKEQGIVMPGG